MIGQILNTRYEVIRLLGEGGMGHVYEAKHTGTHRHVAVKVINSDLVKKNPQAVSRFQREAKAAGAIDTQHIAAVLDTGTDAATGAPYLVMELLEGKDLSQLLEQVGPLSPDVALRIVAQACVGLVKAHHARVIHRDIKPANLFLVETEGGEIVVKILDFGIAKIKREEGQDSETTGLTRSGGMIGSPRYMSPEQARGVKEIDYRTDLWSLGVVLYHALAGRTPHADIDAFGELIMALCSKEPSSVQGIAPWVPKEVAALLHGALRLDRNDRYPSAQAMLDAMKAQIPGGLTLKASELVGLTPEERAVAAPKLEFSTTEPSSQPTATPSRPKLSSSTSEGESQAKGGLTPLEVLEPPRPQAKKTLLLGAALAACIGASGIYGVTRSREQPPSPPPLMPISVESASPPEKHPLPDVTANPSTSPRVQVVILPSDAKVELEGVALPVQGGLVEISGSLGSVHSVRVFKGKKESTAKVIITEAGASPPKIELGPIPPEAVSSGPARGGKTAPRTPATATPTVRLSSSPLTPPVF